VYNAALMPLAIGGERIGILSLFNKAPRAALLRATFKPARASAKPPSSSKTSTSPSERRPDTELVGLQEIPTLLVRSVTRASSFEITERIASMNIAMCGILLYEMRAVSRAQLPFGVNSDLIAAYRIDLQPGSVVYDLWNEENTGLPTTSARTRSSLR
jgi:hypothetical protein